VEILFSLISEAIWELLVKSTNRNIAQKECVSISKKPSSHKFRSTNVQELKIFYALIMEIENTWGNDVKNIREHYQQLQEDLGTISRMGIDRFQVMHSAFAPSILEFQLICDILHDNFCMYVSNINVATPDEGVFDYQASAKAKQKAEEKLEPIPSVFIPRKPHPNGLLINIMATHLADPNDTILKIPYILDLLPHLVVGDLAPHVVFFKFIARWNHKNDRPLFVADAAFGSFDVSLFYIMLLYSICYVLYYVLYCIY
jgi:hypothetical protein